MAMPRIRRTGLRPPWLSVMGAIANSINATAIVPKHPVINGTHPLRKRIGCTPSTPADTEALTTENDLIPFGTHALISDPVVSCGRRRTE
jgi:hypothetical protein